MMRFIEWFKRRFCDHAFQKVDRHTEIDNGVRYSVRVYECLRCGIQVKAGGKDEWKP